MTGPTTPLRVLFVEDSEDDCFLVVRELRAAGFQLAHRRVETRADFLAAIESESWDVILSDHSMPHFTSTEALQAVRDRGFDIPFVIVSGTIGEEQAVAAMRAGARDYVLKHHLGRLSHVINRELRESEGRRRQRVLEAALRTSEEQLRHAQKMEAVGRLASGVAHDFNNLLTAILGFSGFALEQLRPGDPLRHDLEQVVLAAERATRLTSQLLAFSRQQPRSPKLVDVNESIRAIAPMLKRLIGTDVQVATDLDAELAPVVIDPGQLEQVLMNLAVNARDAMPDGGSLTIRTFRMSLDATAAPLYGAGVGQFSAIAVGDTGHGMDAATRARVFEPFFTTKGEGKGTGLGLSTVYGIVTQSGGGIALDTAPGAGTVFTIVLPVAAPDQPAATDATPASVRTHGTETIVLLENDPSVAELVRQVLSSAGYRVIAATSEDEATAALAVAGTADLLLTNLMVGAAPGRDIARRLTQRFPGMRLLYLTGHTSHDAMPEELVFDAGVLLRKPFTPAQLLSTVRARLDEPR